MPITPEYLTYQLNTLTVQRQLEQDILDDIVRRIVKTDFTITDTADWETEKLQQCGVLYRDIVKEIAKKTGKMESEICAIYEDAGTKVFQYDYDGEISDVIKQARAPMSEAMRKIWDASLKKTSTEAVNLTKTMANTSQAAYINACDLAYMKVASGAFSYQTAIRDAVLDIAGKGAWITYPSGHRSAVDAAVRRAVLTGVNQTAGQLQIMRADEIDCDLMEISAHAGARPSHAEWQGQIVSRSGKRGYLSLDDIGYGRADGFMGVNCRHNWYMYFEGNERVYTQSRLDEYKNHTVNYNGETLTDYEASQKQRSMERAVRKQKQKLVCTNTAIKETDDDLLKAELKADFERRSVKLKQREGKLADFCTQTGRREDTFRTQVYGFDRSVSGKAVWSNKRVANSGNGGIIKSNNEKYGTGKSKLQYLGQIDISDKNRIVDILRQYESIIVEQDYETAIVVTNDGDIYKIDGDTNGVRFDGLSEKKLYRAFVTHNHPLNSTHYSFSKYDISAAINNEFSVLRGVDFKYEYEYRTLEHTVKKNNDVIENDFSECYYNVLERVYNKGWDIDLFEYPMSNRIMAKKYNYFYRRKKR